MSALHAGLHHGLHGMRCAKVCTRSTCARTALGLVANVLGMETFTFRAGRALSSICTVEAPPPAQGRPAGLGRLARRPDPPRVGRPRAAQGPEHGRTAPMAHPRCTRLAEVMLSDPETLSHAEKRDGTDQQVVRKASELVRDVCGLSGVPREGTRANEHSVSESSQAFATSLSIHEVFIIMIKRPPRIHDS